MTKSKFFTTAASLALVGASIISVEAFARGSEGGRYDHSNDDRRTLLERMDSNADGVLSLIEFSERNADRALRHFNRNDADGDTFLSPEEFSASDKHQRHSKPGGLDTDSLQLCIEETLGYELPERPNSEAAFAATDVNSDGAVDMDEFLAAGDLRAEERFADINNDGNEQLTSDEIDAYQGLRHEQREAHRSCVGEQLDEDSLLN
ncbi:MAG: Ca2+-binding EF-hand superfamily protein [Halioglobus sp.]|jgi:Ca2+-binding EF-hand superfamily protein